MDILSISKEKGKAVIQFDSPEWSCAMRCTKQKKYRIDAVTRSTNFCMV